MWLTGSKEMFERRILLESGYEQRDERGRAMIEKFLARTVRFNAVMMEAVERLGLAIVRVEEGMGVEDVVAAGLNGMRVVRQ